MDSNNHLATTGVGKPRPSDAPPLSFGATAQSSAAAVCQVASMLEVMDDLSRRRGRDARMRYRVG